MRTTNCAKFVGLGWISYDGKPQVPHKGFGFVDLPYVTHTTVDTSCAHGSGRTLLHGCHLDISHALHHRSLCHIHCHSISIVINNKSHGIICIIVIIIKFCQEEGCRGATYVHIQQILQPDPNRPLRVTCQTTRCIHALSSRMLWIHGFVCYWNVGKCGNHWFNTNRWDTNNNFNWSSWSSSQHEKRSCSKWYPYICSK